jgi:hypothetical protein
MSATVPQSDVTSRSDEDVSFYGNERPDAPLGTLLFRAGLVPDEELRDALETSIGEGRRLGEVLLERKLISEADLTRILASQKGLPFVEVAADAVDLEAARLLPESCAREWGALAIGLEEGRPVVAVGDPANRYAFGRITEALGRKPRFVVTAPSGLSGLLDAVYAELRTRGVDTEAPGGATGARPRRPAGSRAHVLVVLANGERVEVSPPSSRIEALEAAKLFIEGLDERVPGSWPFAEGRFLRPEAVVSVDVVPLPDEAAETGA